jgi:hypothetical protein
MNVCSTDFPGKFIYLSAEHRHEIPKRETVEKSRETMPKLSREASHRLFRIIEYSLTLLRGAGRKVVREKRRTTRAPLPVPEEMPHRENGSREGEPRVVIEPRYTPN